MVAVMIIMVVLLLLLLLLLIPWLARAVVVPIIHLQMDIRRC